MSRKQFEVVCDSLDDFGRGIVRIDGKAIFVDDLLPGEKAKIETVYTNGVLSEAVMMERLADSPYRVKPLCPLFPDCGGCQIMHLDYSRQLIYKRDKVKNLIHKFAKMDVFVDDTIGLEENTHFRNKVQKPLQKNKKGKTVCGFYRKGTHKIVPSTSCLMESELASKITKNVLQLIDSFGYEPYDEDKDTGDVRHILIKTSLYYNQALVTLVVTHADLKGRMNFAKELVKRVPEVKGVVFNINNRHTNVILGEKDVQVYGITRLKDRLFDNDFLISTQSFYQTNSKQVEVLYSLVRDYAKLTKEDTLLDAYCGTGTIGLSLSDQCKEVVGVEIVPDAVRDAVKNAKINNIANATFITEDCTKFIEENDSHFDVVVMDPPRKGATKDFLQAIISMKPKRFVYVSCDPATLARDLGILKSAFRIEKVTPVDMFPNTMHVETVVQLSRKI